jgi:REP element-mobilizing transposase RayT
MARLARVVVPGVPHHITQRGNRRQETFFCEADYEAYVELLAEWCKRCSVQLWAYCLMPNHVHLTVRAKLCQVPWRWQWSSAASHISGREDRLLDVSALRGYVNDWRSFLADGLDADDAQLLRRHERTGRPLGRAGFIERLEKMLGRVLRRNKPGRKSQKKPI